MKINLFKLLLLMPIFFINLSALAINIDEIESFSNHSILIQGYNKRKPFTQEQKNILISKKLVPNVNCLVKQIEKKNIDNVRLLLDIGVDPNGNYMSEYPIYIATQTNNFEMVKLLHSMGAKIDKGFNSELYIAVKNKNKLLAQYLIDNGAKVNYKDSVTDNTILYMSLKNKMYNISKQLINKGARIDIRSVNYIKSKKLYYLIEDKIEKENNQ